MGCLRTMFPRGGRWPERAAGSACAAEDPVEFAALMIGSVEDAPGADVDVVVRPEIIAGAVVIRLEAGASAERIVSIVRALAATP